MPDILPILHPIFVHFTIALLTSSAVLFLLARLFAPKPWADWALGAAFWNLWLGAGGTVATVISGFVAADSTAVCDTTAYSAMTSHRNWAWATALSCLVATHWSIVDPRGTGRFRFLGVLLLMSALLTVTGWKGGTLVYRYGVAVEPVESEARSRPSRLLPLPDRTILIFPDCRSPGR